ncbi:MAG TPA: hypothetical protein DHW65_10570 [Dehalococcoidia bacterium]|nr:hypothetical protein [Dehalococcoidia bacterium]
MSHELGRKQVSLTVFENEPTARMAEQRLQQEGIPCVVRSLRGGPGLWGSTYNIPHDLLVNEEDEMRARDILDVPPQEMEELERAARDPSEKPQSMPVWMLTLIMIVIVTVLAIAVVVGSRATT